MKRSPGSTVRTTTAGPRLRCFLDALSASMGQRVLLLLVGVFIAQSWLEAQIVDCINPATVHVSRIHGQIFDPTGSPIPAADVAVRRGEKQLKLVKADSNGRFDVRIPTGQYSLEVSFSPFQSLNVEADVGQDLRSLAHPTNLYVILGLAGLFCSWATTSRREFQLEVRRNKRRIEEAAHRYATQD